MKDYPDNLIVAFEGVRDFVDILILLEEAGLMERVRKLADPMNIKTQFKQFKKGYKDDFYAINISTYNKVIMWCGFKYYSEDPFCDYTDHEKIILRRKSHE